MNRPTMLLWRVLLDVGSQSSDSITKDFREIESRYQNEGMSFLTIALPRLDDALTKALCRGRLTVDDFPGFKPWKRHGSLPALLQGFFRRIFDRDGWLLPSPDTDAIYAIRQVTRLFKKVELPCSNRRIAAAYERYVSNDQEMDWESKESEASSRLWASVCGFLWSDLQRFSEGLYCSPGKFGSGATAERAKLNERLAVKQWPERAEWLYPAAALAVSTEDSPDLDSIEWISFDEESPVRVVQVPKTLKTPRTISVEPSYMMLMQQSVMIPLVQYLESKSFGFQSIRFTDQTVNRSLALKGSTDGGLATIDLSDASDLVSNDLVRNIFQGCAPHFLELIQGCRSRTALLPDGSTIELKKYASMGSALCFPIEAMVFFTIVMYVLVRESGRRPSRRLLQSLAKDVAVYGDDIIVKSQMAPEIMKTLEDFGLRVNHDKSFHTGLFRESCGGDYYAGVDVTPVYVRQWNDSGTMLDKSLLIDYVSLSNQFYMKGLWHASQFIRDVVGNERIPLSRFPIGILHYASFVRSDGIRWDSNLQRFRVKGWGIRSSLQHDPYRTMSAGMLGSFNGKCDPEVDRIDHYESDAPVDSFGVPHVYARTASRGVRFGFRGSSTVSCLSTHTRGHFDAQPYSSMGRCTTFSLKHAVAIQRSAPLKGQHSVRPYSRSLKSRWCLSPEVLNL